MKKSIKYYRIITIIIISLVFVFSDNPLYARKNRKGESGSSNIGFSSYYGKGFYNRKTANGERFSKDDFTAAHRYLPFGTMLRVTNLHNQKSVVVRVNDRGPFVKGRLLDLSFGAADELDMINRGVAKVKIEILSETLGEKDLAVKAD